MYAGVSLVLPSYDEEVRLIPYLLSIRDYLARHLCAHEVIVVDDGGRDGTGAMVFRESLSWPQLSVLRHDTNLGKGHALRTGVAAMNGDLLLVADADGATPISDEAKLRRMILQGNDIVIGSRRMDSEGIKRSWCRKLVGEWFAWTVRRMFGLPIRDTQCGFKMFRGEVAKRLFALCKEDGYLIDVEVLLHAHRLGYKIVEVPVSWRDVPGSKVRLFRDGWRMLTGLWRLKKRMKEFEREGNCKLTIDN